MNLHLDPDPVAARTWEFVGEDNRVAFGRQPANDLEVLPACFGALPFDEPLLGSHGNVAEGVEVSENGAVIPLDHRMTLHSEIWLEERWKTIRFEHTKTERGFGFGQQRLSRVPLQREAVGQRKISRFSCAIRGFRCDQPGIIRIGQQA